MNLNLHIHLRNKRCIRAWWKSKLGDSTGGTGRNHVSKGHLNVSQRSLYICQSEKEIPLVLNFISIFIIIYPSITTSVEWNRKTVYCPFLHPNAPSHSVSIFALIYSCLLFVLLGFFLFPHHILLNLIVFRQENEFQKQMGGFKNLDQKMKLHLKLELKPQ